MNLNTNFFGTLAVTKAFLPALHRPEGAAIVNLLTLVALASMPAIGGYSAAKAALHSMTQALRAELAPKKIEVFGVFPGSVDTDMIRSFDMPKTSAAAVARAIVDGVNRGEEDIAPDPMSREMLRKWRANPKDLECVFATM